MSWKGNKCPGIEEYHTFESQHCLQVCDHQCVPASVLVHIANRASVDKHIGEYVSATALLGCLRSLYLERTNDWYQEPPTSWFSVRGTLLHAILENPNFEGLINDMGAYIDRLIEKGQAGVEAGKLWLALESDLLALASMLPKPHQAPDWQSEVEFELPLGIINGKERALRGTVDVLRPLAGEILDYKTCGDKSLPYIGKFGPKPEHVTQFNIYRLMVMKGFPVGKRDTYKPIEIKKIKAFYLSMMQILGTGSTMVDTTPWLGSEPKSYGSEISREVVNERDDVVMKRGKKRDSDNPEDYQISTKKRWKLVYDIPDVPLMPLDDVWNFVVEKATILFKAFDDGIVPSLPSPEIMAWKCDSFCSVKSYCDKICTERGEVRTKKEEESSLVPVEGDTYD